MPGWFSKVRPAARHPTGAEGWRTCWRSSSYAGTREALSIFFITPNGREIAPELQFILDRLDPTRQSHAGLCQLHLRATVRFVKHRENILRGPLTLLVDRFCPGVAPDDLHGSVPELLAALTGGRATDTANRFHGTKTGSQSAAVGRTVP